MALQWESCWSACANVAPARAADGLRGIAVSVNAEYAQASHLLRDGDEVGLFLRSPAEWSCADGCFARGECFGGERGEPTVVIALTREPIGAEKIVTEAKSGEDGAVVVFDGIVRNHSRGRRTLHLDYEAYDEMAVRQMRGSGGRHGSASASARWRWFTAWDAWRSAKPAS